MKMASSSPLSTRFIRGQDNGGGSERVLAAHHISPLQFRPFHRASESSPTLRSSALNRESLRSGSNRTSTFSHASMSSRSSYAFSSQSIASFVSMPRDTIANRYPDTYRVWLNSLS